MVGVSAVTCEAIGNATIEAWTESEIGPVQSGKYPKSEAAEGWEDCVGTTVQVPKPRWLLVEVDSVKDQSKSWSNSNGIGSWDGIDEFAKSWSMKSLASLLFMLTDNLSERNYNLKCDKTAGIMENGGKGRLLTIQV